MYKLEVPLMADGSLYQIVLKIEYQNKLKSDVKHLDLKIGPIYLGDPCVDADGHVRCKGQRCIPTGAVDQYQCEP